jgi:hypothetical protein
MTLVEKIPTFRRFSAITIQISYRYRLSIFFSSNCPGSSFFCFMR